MNRHYTDSWLDRYINEKIDRQKINGLFYNGNLYPIIDNQIQNYVYFKFNI